MTDSPNDKQLNRVEEALRESEQRYERVMLAAEAGFWDWDIPADEFYVSPKLLEMTDFPPGTRFASRADFMARAPFHPDDRTTWEDAVKELFTSGGTRLAMEIRSIHAGGEIRWALLSGMCVRDATGKIMRWTGSATDVTARKRAEEARRRSEERYAVAMEAAGDGHTDWNLVTGESYISPRLLRMLGYPADATFIDRADWVRRFPFHPDDRKRWEAAIAAHFAGGEAKFKMDLRIVVNGETRWVAATFIATRDAAGNVLRWTGSIADINDAKRDLATVLDAVPGMVALLSPTAEVEAVNNELLAYLGQPLEAIKQWGTNGIVLPEDVPRAADVLRQAMSTGQPYETEVRVRRFDGVYRWNSTRGLPFLDSSGGIVRWYAMISDIDDRKRAEDGLRVSEERYALAMEASEEGHFDWNVQTDEIFASEHLKQILDLPANVEYRTREDMVSRIRFGPGDRERVAEMTRNVLAGAALHNEFEYRLFRGEVPEIRWIRARWKIFRDAQGVAQRVIGVVSDVTERKRVEEELRSRQEMLEVAQKAARAAAFEWRVGSGEGEEEGEGKNHWSPALEVMHGIPPGSYDGTYESWKQLVHPEDWPSVRDAIKTAQQTGDVDAEYRVLLPGAAVRWLQAKGRMLFNSGGKPARLVGFVLDVTDRHLAEQELRRMERQLRQAQRLEAMGALAGGIAHDFNNILGAIVGYGEMALRGTKQEHLRRDLDAIMSAGERGRALIERILAFSRSGVGERVPVHVEAVVREALDQVAARLPASVTIKPRLHAGRAAMLGDSTQVHQVVMNLASNAVQAMPQGGVLRVDVATARLDAARPATVGSIAPGDYIVLEVSDTGTGIPQDVLDHMFDPFFTTKEMGVGSGLGLSLVHGIVTSVDGAIDVVTRLGRGSTFTIYLRRAGEAAETSVDEDPPLPRGEGQRVLIVDDEEALVDLAVRTLEELGYEPAGLTSSAAALEVFRDDPGRFHAVITDERMPGLSGSALIREVRRISAVIPIVLMSGFVDAAAELKARELGATDVLRKPLLARDLAASLARVLHRP